MIRSWEDINGSTAVFGRFSDHVICAPVDVPATAMVKLILGFMADVESSLSVGVDPAVRRDPDMYR